MAQTDTWITITKADCQASVNDSEFEALLSIAIAAGQADPTLTLIPDVTAEVRGYVRRRNTLGPAGTIPQELKNAAIDIIVYRTAKRINNSDSAKAWKTANDEAEAKLEKVAEGTIYVSEPLTASTEVTSAPAPAIEHRHLRFGYEEERGV